jgi:hypothetical protein
MSTDQLRSRVRKALAAACVLLAAAPCFAQHAGLRQQWQPQTEGDPRLQQPVEVEVLGRAAATGLPLLAEKIGVSLSVAPEDLATVGERKFTVIAKGCTLKAIMVQLAEALQECHWDVDVSGEQQAYLLHRNAGAEFEALEAQRARVEEDSAQWRATRMARLDDGRRALKMTPEELKELEQTDPILARAVQEPQMRAAMEALYALPPEQMRDFEQTGQVVFTYAQAPPQLRKAADLAMEWSLREEEQRPAQRTAELFAPQEARDEGFAIKDQALAQMKQWKERPERVVLQVNDEGLDCGFGVRLRITVPMGSEGFGANDAMLPPSKVSTDEGSGAYLRMLVATGAAPDPAAAMEIVQRSERKGFREEWERAEARRRQWVEPTDPELLKTITLGDREFRQFADLEWFVAGETGLSVVSDYFTGRGPYFEDDLRGGVPLWQLLYRAGEGAFRASGVRWSKAGAILVLHAVNWYDLAQSEMPEALLQECREKLAAQGELTLDDLAGVAVALGGRRVSFDSIPQDLWRTGLMNLTSAAWALTFYASLSPEQLVEARSAAGLPYSAMTIAQRQLVQQAVAQLHTGFRPTPEEVSEAVLFITDTAETRGSGEQTRTFLSTRFRLQSGEREFNNMVTRVKAGP